MNAPALAPGTSVGGRWQVAAFIGRGELGEVYAVRDPLSGQPGALKRFAPALLDHADAWAAFDKAAQAVAALPFDGFAKRIDSGKDTAPWVVTDRVVWPSLADQIRAGGALPIERLAAMLEALAPALDAAHAAGLVHRDLKPGNVFVEPAEKPTVHITDFGVWRLRVALGLAPGWAATPGWLGPDAADPAEASTPRMDVFALGLVVFHALTGHSRFRAVEREPLDTAALWTQMLEPIGSASALAAELGAPLDAALDDWFSQALAPRPEQRFESVGTMAGNFRAAVQSNRRRVLEAAGAPRPCSRAPAWPLGATTNGNETRARTAAAIERPATRTGCDGQRATAGIPARPDATPAGRYRSRAAHARCHQSADPHRAPVGPRTDTATRTRTPSGRRSGSGRRGAGRTRPAEEAGAHRAAGDRGRRPRARGTGTARLAPGRFPGTGREREARRERSRYAVGACRGLESGAACQRGAARRKRVRRCRTRATQAGRGALRVRARLRPHRMRRPPGGAGRRQRGARPRPAPLHRDTPRLSAGQRPLRSGARPGRLTPSDAHQAPTCAPRRAAPRPSQEEEALRDLHQSVQVSSVAGIVP